MSNIHKSRENKNICLCNNMPLSYLSKLTVISLFLSHVQFMLVFFHLSQKMSYKVGLFKSGSNKVQLFHLVSKSWIWVCLHTLFFHASDLLVQQSVGSCRISHTLDLFVCFFLLCHLICSLVFPINGSEP